MTLSDLATRAAAEIRDAVAAIDPAALEGMVTELAQAKRVVCYGVGREGLMMRALAMRLYHIGLDAHVVGDMSCPPVGPGRPSGRQRGAGRVFHGGRVDRRCAQGRGADRLRYRATERQRPPAPPTASS
jgi:hypothetical protein